MIAIEQLTRRLRDEAGYSLTELLVGMVVSLIVLGATLTAFEGFQRRARDNQLQNDAQERARVTIDRLARELRNAGSASVELPQGIERAEPYDLIAQSAAPGPATGGVRPSRRVRYCLDAAAAADARLVRQVQTWTGSTPPPLPTDTACPGPTTAPTGATGSDAEAIWTTTEVTTDKIVNRINGQERPVFLYDRTVLNEIRQVRAELFVDYNPGARPAESRLLSGVLLRNQNRSPTAAFTVTRSVDGIVILNGSSSADPDGDALTFAWYDGSQEIGSGMLFEYRLPAGTRTLGLTVRDPSGQTATAPTRTVAP